LTRCIIVEDELLAQQVIQNHLQKLAGFELVGVCQNAREATAFLAAQAVDLIFLDIQLPGMDGLNFLRSLHNPPLVVFTTAYAEYALEGYEFNVIDYLLKPISFERFSKTINKIEEGRLFVGNEKESVTADHMFVKSGNQFFKVRFADIIFVEGMKDYLKIHAEGYQLVTHQTMNEMEKMLVPHRVTRVHKSYLVAERRITRVLTNSLELGKISIPIGSTYKDKVVSLLGRKD
jgi:DNA-binding LytR/AlgR family response regulator